MATPTVNTVPVTDYNTSIFNTDVDSLFCGTKWGDGLGTGVTLTYSFPQSGGAWWLSPYSSDAEPDSYYGLNDVQMAAAEDAMASWAAVANVQFTEVSDDQNTVGEIRFAFTDNIGSGFAAQAYLPSDDPTAGDVWFNSTDRSNTAGKGSFFYNTIIHELGHSLGLNHSFDLTSGHDNLFYSVMSYTASPWSADGDNYASFYPTTPMYYDIVAMQAIYGTDGLTTNSGDTTYAFADKRYFQTIFDTGGNDTIVYSGTDTCNINLNIGSFCAVGKVIQFNGGSSRATVAIGPNTVIENATGGARNDRIVGNSANNNLKGSGGHDSLYGGAGSDTITGGSSTDKLKGNSGADLFDFNKLSEIGTTSHDIIVDFKPGVDDIDLSTIDANSLVAGNDLFSFKAKADASLNGHAGELCWYNSSGKTFVIGDINGDKVADFKLELTGTLTLTAGDFIL